MVGSTAGRQGAWMVSRFAYAAGVTGTLANLFLIAFFAFRFGGIGGASFGPVNDLVGSLATTFMVPVALAVLTVGGPLLVLGVLSFEVQAPIVTAAWLILCLWLFLVNRWLRSSGVLAPRLAWFGEFVSAGTAAGIAIFGLGGLDARHVAGPTDPLRVWRCYSRDRDARHPGVVRAPGPAPVEGMSVLRQGALMGSSPFGVMR